MNNKKPGRGGRSKRVPKGGDQGGLEHNDYQSDYLVG